MSFSKSQIAEAKYLFEQAILKYFGEIWNPPSDGEYVGCSWEARSLIPIDGGLWRLAMAVKHKGGTRVFGKIDTKDAGDTLVFILFYNKKIDELERVKIWA